jgi:hypothetical protein
MSVLADVALPKIDVLGSTIAYREGEAAELVPAVSWLLADRLNGI